MSNVWEEIGKITPDLANPREIVNDLFKPISNYTKNRVGFRIQQVNFFPEEVEYTTFGEHLTNISLFAATITNPDIEQPRKKSHPEFGYNPEVAKQMEYFRYRLLLFPVLADSVEIELFKFKFPFSFYPITFLIEKKDFPELSDFTSSSGLLAGDEEKLIMVVETIIKSASTLRLIKRLMVL